MKLLDKPIHKTAAIDNREALVKLLMGGGLGAAMGGLGEYATTGKLGWKGALAGGALGAGTMAAMDPGLRERIVQAYRSRKQPTPPTEQTAAQPGVSRVQGEGRARLSAANELYNDPKYTELMRLAARGGQSEYMPGEGTDLSPVVADYVRQYKQTKGGMPDPEHLRRFIDHATTLKPEEWGSYMSDTHALSGEAIPNTLADTSALLGGTVGAKVLKGKVPAKYSAGLVPGMDLLMDIPDLFVDDKTGKFRMNVFRNIKNRDKMMELRERHGENLIGGKRNALYNLGAGILTGRFRQATTPLVAARRGLGAAEQGYEQIASRGIEGYLQHQKAMNAAALESVADLATPLRKVWNPNAKSPSINWGTTHKAPTGGQAYKRLLERYKANKGPYKIAGKDVDRDTWLQQRVNQSK